MGYSKFHLREQIQYLTLNAFEPIHSFAKNFIILTEIKLYSIASHGRYCH